MIQYFRTLKNINWSVLLFIMFLSLGIYLRIVGIDKPEGLWYDEINTYFIAKQSFPQGIFHALMERDLHFPLYYMFLHVWMNIFGESDIALRASSGLFGILTLPISYLAGKELYGKKGGLITLLFFSMNSGLIYYSQEVRFYSLIAFLATLIIYFLLKIKNKDNVFNYTGLIIANLIVIYTWTIGCIFVFIEMFLFLLYLIFTKKAIKKFILSGITILILSLPVFPLLIYFSIKNNKLLFNYFDYYQFNSYILLNLMDVIGGPLAPRIGFVYTKIFSVLISVSALIFAIFIVKSITKKKIVLVVFLIGLIPLLLELFLSLQNKFALIYCHTIFSIPFFIITASCGVFNFKNKKILYVLLSVYLCINLGYTFFSPKGVTSIKRNDGYNVVAKELNLLSATNQDVLILLPLGGYMTIKYDYKAKTFPLSLNDYSFNSKDTLNHIFDDSFVKSLNKENVYDKLKPFVYSKKPTAKFYNFVEKEIEKVPLNRYVYVVVINWGSLKYSREHIIDSVRKKIIVDTFNIINNNEKFKLYKIKKLQGWTIVVYKRIH